MSRARAIGLSVLAAVLFPSYPATVELRVALVVSISGVPVPVEAQPRTVIEQERGATDRARIRLDGPHGIAFARTIGPGDPVDVVIVVHDGPSNPLFRGAVSKIEMGFDGAVIEASSAEPALVEIAPGRSFTVAPGVGDARLLDFAARLSARSSVQGVLVMGILESTGEPIAGRAIAPAIPLGEAPGDWSGATVTVETGRRFVSIDEADAFARAMLADLLSTRVAAELLTDGLAGIKVATVVEVQGAGEKFDGQYYVTGVTHRFGGGSYGGYSTALRVRRSDFGMFHHPAIDDEVLVSFQGGDLLQPYIVGSLWDCDADGRDQPTEGDHRCRLLRWPW